MHLQQCKNRLSHSVVQELQHADKLRRQLLLKETFAKRREWVFGADGPSISDFLHKYSVFVSHPEEVSINKWFQNFFSFARK